MNKRLIYAEDAINAVAKGLKGVFVEYQDVAEKLLNNVPSVQPEPPEDICGECDAWNKYKSEIKALPSAQPGQRWTPVTEALPRDDEEVIVTCLDDSGDTPYSYTTVAWHYKGMWVCDNTRCLFVIAWMLLPEPYEGDESDA